MIYIISLEVSLFEQICEIVKSVLQPDSPLIDDENEYFREDRYKYLKINGIFHEGGGYPAHMLRVASITRDFILPFFVLIFSNDMTAGQLCS